MKIAAPEGIRRILDVGWLLAALPIITSAIAAWRDSWLPYGDTAIVAAKVTDVWTSDPPLVGGWTSLGRADVEPLHHAGPLALWFLAIPTRLVGGDGVGMMLGAALLAVLSVAGIAFAARRLGDLEFEFATLALTLFMIAQLSGHRLVEPNAPHVGVLPLLLVMVTTVAVLSGHHRQLWLLVAAGSLTAQTHLGYLPLVGAMLVLVAIGMVVESRRRPEVRPQLLGRTLPIAFGIGVVAWIGPIVDQLFASQNLTRVVTSRLESDEPAVGFGAAFDLAVDVAAVPGGWMRRAAADGFLPDPGTLEILWAVVVVIGVTVFAVASIRSGRRIDSAIGVVGLTSLVVGTVSAAGVTQLVVGQGLLYYRFFWWPVGVVFTAAVLRAVVAIVRAIGATPTRTVDQPRAQWAMASALVVLAAVLVPVGHSGANEDTIAAMASTPANADAVVQRFGDGAEVVLRLDDPAGAVEVNDGFGLLVMTPSTIAELRLAGVDVRFRDEPFDPDALGPIAAYQYDNRTSTPGLPQVYFRVGAAALETPPDGLTALVVDGGDGVRIATALFIEAP